MTPSIPADSITGLLDNTPNSLFKELGIRVHLVDMHPELKDSSDPKLERSDELSPGQDFEKVGKLFFDKVNKQMYGLFCGTDEAQSADRKALADAFKLGPTELALTLSSLLIAYHVVPPTIAVVLASLLVKVCYKPAHESICQVWSEKFPSA